MNEREELLRVLLRERYGTAPIRIREAAEDTGPETRDDPGSTDRDIAFQEDRRAAR